MCEPESVDGALAMLDRVLDYLNAADVASLPVDTQAGALKRLETVEAKQTAARAALLSAFSANGGPEADGHGVARTWLRWQTRITRGAAAGAVAWMRRLAAHPVIEAALAGGEISASWARELCAWTDRLPLGVRDDADRLLCQAAADGADLDDLGRLAEAIYQRTRGPDQDGGPDGFDERSFHLGITFSGAGRAQGDLSPGCAAALLAVLEALGKKAGPGRHPDRRPAPSRRAGRRLPPPGRHRHAARPRRPAHPGSTAATCGCWCGGCTCPARPPLRPAARRGLARALLGLAIDALSGPGGLAATLRASLAGTELSLAAPLTSISLPLDIGTGSEAIPAHLRRAVTLRHPHCAFPGCDQPATVCDVHHLVPRSEGGATALPNLVPLCRFHHLIAIHHGGWTLRLNPDGTTTATSPDGHRIWHSHGPPGRAA